MSSDNDDKWYLAIVATRAGNDRAYTTVMCTRDPAKLVAYIAASPAPLISRCLAHPVKGGTTTLPSTLFDGDTYVDSESDDGGMEEEAAVKEDIARQYAEVQQIQLLQQQQLPPPILPPPPALPLNRDPEPGEPRDPVFRRSISLFSRESPRRAYPQSVMPGAPHDWVERTSASVDLDISLAIARSVRTGTATPTDTARRFDHMRKSLTDESRARNPRQPLWVQGLDQLRRKQETLRKKRKTNEETAQERSEELLRTDQQFDGEDDTEEHKSRPLPQHIALLRMRRAQNGHLSSLPVAGELVMDSSNPPKRRATEKASNELVFAAGPYSNYEKARAASLAVCKVKGLTQRVAEATELATRARVHILRINIATVLASDEKDLFVYRGTVWSGVPKEIAEQLKNET